jgi:glycosyltransferase involved in cell wall biosynthesis
MTADKPRLLLLITDLILGGAARVVRDHADMLAARYEVHQAVFNTADGVGVAGDTPHSLGTGAGGGPLRKLINLAQRVRRARALKRRLRIDVSISHLEGAHWVDVMSRGSDRVILAVHGSIQHNRDIAGPLGWLRRRVLTPLIYNQAARVVPVSRDIARELTELGVAAERIRTINNSFDHARIRSMADQPLSPDEAQLFGDVPVLLTMGRLHEQKNHSGLLSVFAELTKRRPARLLLLGDGPLGSSLVDQARALGLDSWAAWEELPLRPGAQVYFLGAQENPFRFARAADLFVLSSGWEGFPLALCEAMICGLPIASTDCPTGPREILAPDSRTPAEPIRAAERTSFGLLLPVLDESPRLEARRTAWVEALVELLDRPGERAQLAAAAQRRMEDFTRERIGAQWCALIDEVLEERQDR